MAAAAETEMAAAAAAEGKYPGPGQVRTGLNGAHPEGCAPLFLWVQGRGREKIPADIDAARKKNDCIFEKKGV